VTPPAREEEKAKSQPSQRRRRRRERAQPRKEKEPARGRILKPSHSFTRSPPAEPAC
jgi:hypothetical protein